MLSEGKRMEACLFLPGDAGSAVLLDFHKLEVLVGVGLCSITGNDSTWTRVTSASFG